MAENTIEISIPLLLPEVQDEGDQCVCALQNLLHGCKGILKTHLEAGHSPIDLCIHYDPNLVSLGAVKRLAQEAGSQLSSSYHHVQVPFTGLDSADTVQTLAEALEKLPGVLHASLSYAAGLASVAYDEKQLSLAEIERLMRSLGATPLPLQTAAEGRHRSLPFLPEWLQERWTLGLVAASGLLWLLGWSGERFLGWPVGVTWPLLALSYVAGGYEIAAHGIPSLLRGKFDTDVLMLAAAAGAAALGEWAEGAFLLFLFSLGHAGEHYALDRARHAINALGELMPGTARVRRGDQIREEPVDRLHIGDLALVRPGDRLPVDGIVSQGQSAVDQSPITGESMPVQKQPGDEVFAGTINQTAALEVQVTRRAQDTTLSRVIQLVAEAQSQQSPTQQMTERFMAWFVPGVLGLVLLTAALPPILGWMPFSQSFYRAMLLLVGASPCALAVGAPAAVLSGIAQAARNGVLIKGGAHLETLGRLQVMAFDKTGTLTAGRFQVTDVIAFDGVGEDDLLRLAGAVEQQANHPLALAVTQAAADRSLTLPPIDGLENLPGLGVRSRVEGALIVLGSLKLFEIEPGYTVDGQTRRALAALEAQGRTTILVGKDQHLLGVLGLADTPRPGAAQALQRLQALGVKKLVMLTGDTPQAAQPTAHALGVTDVQAGLLPEDKLRVIRDLQAHHGPVAMIGDGVNDAPALAAASVGVAMGGAGTAVALETADVALMADDLHKLPFAVGLSRASRAIIVQNLVIALAIIAGLILTSVLGLIQLSGAVVLHEGSTVVVALNALRLLRYRAE